MITSWLNFNNVLLTIYKKKGVFYLYVISFVLSVCGCLSLGILTLFSVFTGPFEDVLGYSQNVINRVIIFQTLGLNLFTPLSGYIADVKGIWILSLLAFSGYMIGFSLIFFILETQVNYRMMYLAFFIIGCSHASFLFCCLLNSAKSLGQYYKTLAISTPNMMVSFSSFIQILILSRIYRSDPKDNFKITLRFFWISLTLSTAISFIACKMTDTIQIFQEKYDHTEREQIDNFDSSPLLTGAGTLLHSPSGSILGSPRSWYVDNQLNLDDELSLNSGLHPRRLTASDILDPDLPYRTKLRLFFKDPLMYPLITCCLMSISATEFFIANLGSIIKNLNLTNLDESLQLYSIFSTLTRFIIMILTDYICTRLSISRLTIFTTMVILCGISHLYLSSVPESDIKFGIVIILNAILNSGVFTLFPAVLASIYGLDILGTTWGIFSASSVVGNLFFNLLYSFDFTKNCVKIVKNNLVICSTLTFFVSGCILLILGLLILYIRQAYIKRSPEFF